MKRDMFGRDVLAFGLIPGEHDAMCADCAAPAVMVVIEVQTGRIPGNSVGIVPTGDYYKSWFWCGVCCIGA